MTTLEMQGAAARSAARVLAKAQTRQKNAALLAIAQKLDENRPKILSANAQDMETAQRAGMKTSFLDRLLLTNARLDGMIAGLREVIALGDPCGEFISMRERPNGLRIGQKRVPIGVLGIIYEARPNVTVDAAALCLKSGNAVILRGGKEAIASNTALIGCCFALYRLVTLDFDSKTAMRCVRYFLLMPLTYYFDSTYSESTFLLLTVLTMLCARRRKWLWAGVLGALTTYSRMQGAVVAGYIMIEGVMAALEDRRNAKEWKRAYWKRTLFSAAGASAMCAIGLLVYLYMNWVVYSGDAFKFLEYEKDIWSQTRSTPWATLNTDWGYLLSEGYDIQSRLGMWGGNLFFAWGALLLAVVALRRVRPSYLLYLLAYLYVVLSPSWLLSGARYITACAAAYPMLACVGDRKWRDWIITLIMLGALAVYGVLYYVYASVL